MAKFIEREKVEGGGSLDLDGKTFRSRYGLVYPNTIVGIGMLDRTGNSISINISTYDLRSWLQYSMSH
ncbi:MAG TPA: hypothetical protein VEH06_01535 [Candidatus Bathyarchaeia archaeon]|nr:hypothetical protein [Candidatus Bathyarchaeia archaeon]